MTQKAFLAVLIFCQVALTRTNRIETKKGNHGESCPKNGICGISIGYIQGYSGAVSGRRYYVYIVSAFWCRFRGEIAEIAVFN